MKTRRYALCIAVVVGLFVPLTVFTKVQGTTMQDLSDLGATLSGATAINSRGQVAGFYELADGKQRPFIWSESTGMVGLGTLGGTWSGATAINNRGQVVGWSWLAGDLANHAFVWNEHK